MHSGIPSFHSGTKHDAQFTSVGMQVAAGVIISALGLVTIIHSTELGVLLFIIAHFLVSSGRVQELCEWLQWNSTFIRFRVRVKAGLRSKWLALFMVCSVVAVAGSLPLAIFMGSVIVAAAIRESKSVAVGATCKGVKDAANTLKAWQTMKGHRQGGNPTLLGDESSPKASDRGNPIHSRKKDKHKTKFGRPNDVNYRIASTVLTDSAGGVNSMRDSFWKATGDESAAIVRASTPSPADHEVKRTLIKEAMKCIYPIIPEAELHCVGCGNFELQVAQGRYCEVDLVLKIDAQILLQRLTEYFLQSKGSSKKNVETLQADCLRKTATRVISRRLGFVKFGRSEFTSPDPTIFLIVPPAAGIYKHTLRMSFSVNSVYPLHLQTLVSKDSSRVRELIFIVLRWSDDRHLASPGKGLLHPYAWGLLVSYFLRSTSHQNTTSTSYQNMSTAELFEAFLCFFHSRWTSLEDVAGVTISVSESGVSATTIWGDAVMDIKDPFDSQRSASSSLRPEGMTRIKEEMQRAIQIFNRRGSGALAEICELMTPDMPRLTSGKSSLSSSSKDAYESPTEDSMQDTSEATA